VPVPLCLPILPSRIRFGVMKIGGSSMAIRDLQTLFEIGTIVGLSDGQLLDCFIARGEGVVFEAMIRRHGPMVWGVCRRILRDHHDAEDAFQATFLVLARKASSVRPREKVGNWLYGATDRVSDVMAMIADHFIINQSRAGGSKAVDRAR